MSKSSISIRAGFRWLPDSFTETTSTVVLTTDRGNFVDIRLFLPLSKSSKLQWGFAGHAYKSNAPSPPYAPGTVQGCWVHEVDSTSLSIIEDEGYLSDMKDMPGKTLEIGSMADEHGHIKNYEEIWEDEDIRSSGGFSVIVLELAGGPDELKVTGKIVSLGRFCQGIMRDHAGELTSERWEHIDGVWQLVWRTGSSQLPCGDFLLSTRPWSFGIGDRVRAEDLQWVVVEFQS